MLLQKLKLGPRFNLLLALVFTGGFILSGVALSQVLQDRAQAEVTTKAQILIQTMNSVRDYTTNHIQPLLNPQLETASAFIPETVPAYSATEVFQNLRKKEDYRGFFYKEATINPTNLRDKADAFEVSLVERFRNEPNTKSVSGFRDLRGGRIFYIARPLAIKKESCLRCHSTPEKAPKSQITTYGSENGFGWKLNDIIAAQIISVPAEDVLNNAWRFLGIIMAILLGVFLVLVFVINYFLRQSVIRPIRRMARTAEAVSMGELAAEFEQKSEDEIGALAAAFNRMKSSLEISMNLLNKRKLD
jgi:HAMP domain-containing protein